MSHALKPEPVTGARARRKAQNRAAVVTDALAAGLLAGLRVALAAAREAHTLRRRLEREIHDLKDPAE